MHFECSGFYGKLINCMWIASEEHSENWSQFFHRNETVSEWNYCSLPGKTYYKNVSSFLDIIPSASWYSSSAIHFLCNSMNLNWYEELKISKVNFKFRAQIWAIMTYDSSRQSTKKLVTHNELIKWDYFSSFKSSLI